jgi:glycosyltransferase involved in cell wall biosynthesis
VRVVVVSAWEPWRLTDGAVWVLHHHLRSLAGRHDLTVLAAGAAAAELPPPDDARTLPEGISVRWFGTSRSAAVDYAARRVGAWRSGEPAHVAYVERPALLDALRAEIRTARPDVVHAFGWGTAGLWRYADGVPVVHVAVDAWHVNAANRRLPGWRRLADAGELRRVRAHEQRHYPRAAAVVVVSPTDAAQLRDLVPGARVEVVANGVDAGPEPSPAPTRPVLGFHGSFEARHNVDAARVLVEEVLPRVRRDVPDAGVLLAGRVPGPDVRALAGDGVELRADVADIRTALDDMAVYAAPLVSGSGLKNKVLEAMAAGRPVVTTPLGSAGIGAGAGLVEVAGPAELADAAVSLLRDRARLTAEGRAGRDRVLAEFTWDASAAAMEAVWRSVTVTP